MTRIVKILAALAVVVGAGLSGFGVGYVVGGMRASESSHLTFATPEPKTGSSALQSEFGTFWEVWRIVESEYYDPTVLDYKKLTYGAISGMLATLGDPHTAFSSPTAARISDEDIKGSFDGIGAQLEMRENRLTIVAPIEGTPAERAGVRAGDRIVLINDEDAAKLTLTDAVAKIRGPRGSIVRLTLARDGTADPFVVSIVREEIRPINVRTRTIEGGIAYLKLNSFTQDSGNEVRAAIEKLKTDRPLGIVLDLRNNPGGLLMSSVDVASQFLVADSIVLYQSRREGDPIAYRAKSGGLATDLPLVVLVNRGSASASEIVAGALQDQGRAALIGENSFGKDSVQNVHALADKSSVRVTFSRWFTPKRQEIHAKGLQPDVAITLTDDDAKAQRDPQLDRAIEVLKVRIANQP